MNIIIKDTYIFNAIDEQVFKSSIKISNNKIIEINSKLQESKDDVILDGSNSVTMPGLVNTHTHLAMSTLRNSADDMPLDVWLNDNIFPIEEKLTKEDIYWGSMLSILELIRSGTTCINDMYFYMDKVAEAIKLSGIRGVISQGIVEYGNNLDLKLKDSKDLFNNWNNSCDGRIKVAIGPHAPYTCSNKALIKCRDLAKELGTFMHIHLSESKKEEIDNLKEYNVSQTKRLEQIGFFDEVKVCGAHCTQLNKEDIDIFKEKNIQVLNSPCSNLKLGNGFAKINEMSKKNINISLSTDGAASNNNLDMFKEMNYASLINKGVSCNPVDAKAIDVLKMGTINGAKALGFNVGTVEVGKVADLIMVDLSKPNMNPINNIISSLIYSVKSSDVKNVIVNGKIIMKDREILTFDEKEVIENVNKILNRLKGNK